MTIIVKSSNEDAITIPAALMSALNLREGDEVKAIVDGETLRFARLNKFLSLRGAPSGDIVKRRDQHDARQRLFANLLSRTGHAQQQLVDGDRGHVADIVFDRLLNGGRARIAAAEIRDEHTGI